MPDCNPCVHEYEDKLYANMILYSTSASWYTSALSTLCERPDVWSPSSVPEQQIKMVTNGSMLSFFLFGLQQHLCRMCEIYELYRKSVLASPDWTLHCVQYILAITFADPWLPRRRHIVSTTNQWRCIVEAGWTHEFRAAASALDNMLMSLILRLRCKVDLEGVSWAKEYSGDWLL